MAFDKLKGFLGIKKSAKANTTRAEDFAEFRKERTANTESASREKPHKVARKRTNRNRKPDSPYTLQPKLQLVNVGKIEKYVAKNYKKIRTDKFTLLEIADEILRKEIGMPRPAKLKAHAMFRMFTKKTGRIRAAVKTPCLEWIGSIVKGVPTVTTINSQAQRRMTGDARKYIMENPAKGKRRNFRSIPMNLCGNDLCVNPQHLRMVPGNPLRHQGENHPRAKYNDKEVVKMVKEYNAGMSARQLSKKYDISLTYMEQVVRKEKRTKATEGMTIRGRFGER